MAGIILAGIVSVIFGLGSIPSTIPVVDVVQRYPLVAVGAGILLVLITLWAFLVARGAPTTEPDPTLVPARGGGRVPRLAIPTVISTVSTTSFLGLLLLVLVRPMWCPTPLCPAPQLITNMAGVHDTNLEVYFTAVQSAAFVLPGSPSSYASGDLPRSVAAVEIGQQASALPPYRVVIGVHSLQTGAFGLVIEAVTVVIRDVPPVPQTLYVWEAGVPVTYQSNLYEATYLGQSGGSVLVARYAQTPGGFAELQPGEADDLDVQLDSHVNADLQFQVAVTYRVANDTQVHTLTLPRVFEVVFSDDANWHVDESGKTH
jgi:hypothetical protein